jgi:hypothetical protein
MTFKQFRWWCSLGIVLLAMIGCGRTIKSQQTTAVTPTPLNTPTFDGSTVTLSGELALGLETAVVPKPTTSVIPHTPPTSVPDGNPSPVPTATATSFSYNTTRPIPTPIPLSAIELQATIMARPRTYDSFTSISVQEEMAFLGYGEYLVILDISTPSQPTLMSEIPLQNHIKQIQVISDTVYIVLEVSGGPDETQIELQIVDVTDPLNPFKQGVYSPAFLAVDAVVIC